MHIKSLRTKSYRSWAIADTASEAVSDALQADFYFAHPYASWERGTNENTNGLIRQYFPKGYDLATIKISQLAHVVDQINNRTAQMPWYENTKSGTIRHKPPGCTSGLNSSGFVYTCLNDSFSFCYSTINLVI